LLALVAFLLGLAFAITIAYLVISGDAHPGLTYTAR